MPNDSSTGGFLTPANDPINDRPLEDIFHETIVGITGLPPEMVRPRFQPVVPNQPGFEENWCAFAVNPIDQDTFAHEKHLPSLETNGVNEVSRDEMMEVFASFYGASGRLYMTRWLNGLALSQNRYQLLSYGIKLVGFGKPVSVPALLKDKWTRRVDLTAQFSRRLIQTYAVRSIASAEVIIDNELTITTINVNQ